MPLDSAAAFTTQSVPLGHILGSLSYALDLTEGQPPGHCLRACWLGVRIGEQLGLDDAALADLYYAVMLKDVGCSSNAARVAQLYLTDDLAFKGAAKTLPDGVWPAIRFIVRHTGQGRGLMRRLKQITGNMRDAGAIVHELVQTRCERGADIARQLRFSDAVAGGIQGLDEHWDGGGHPNGLGGAAIPLFSRIALLAQVVDVFAVAAGPVAAADEVRARAGTWFDPGIAQAFLAVAAEPGFWSILLGGDIESVVLGLAPGQRMVRVDDDYLDDIAKAFARVIDAKSPYTHGHSDRVARFSGLIASQLGFDAPSTRRLTRAALLHDLGKLGVSNTILDKPSKLDDTEWASVRLHPVNGERILARIGAFDDLVEISGGHHERLDGKGYPRGLDAASISLGTRIVTTADVCDALTAARPYRGPMPVDQMLAIMTRDVGTAFDPACFDALADVAKQPGFLTG